MTTLKRLHKNEAISGTQKGRQKTGRYMYFIIGPSLRLEVQRRKKEIHNWA